MGKVFFPSVGFGRRFFGNCAHCCIVISFGLSTKVIWSAIIALCLYFFMTMRRWNVNKTGIYPVDGGYCNCCFFFRF